jgi:hypothetical protein
MYSDEENGHSSYSHESCIQIEGVGKEDTGILKMYKL